VRLEKAAWHNMGPFSDWSLDLTELDPAQKLVALTGVNGRGKSYCMESAVAGGCYRTMPTQGSVASRATAADSWQESVIVHDGQRRRIKHLVNGATKSRSSETIVTDENGKPVYEGTGVKLFDGWAAQHLPDPEVLFASLFAAQQSEGFVKMTSGDRIGVILRVIGVARLERMAETARKRRDTEAEKLDQLVKRIADIRGEGLTVEQCELQLATVNETIAAFERTVAERAAALEEARQVDAEAQVQAVQRDAAVRELAALRAQLAELKAKREPVAVRVVNNRAVMAEADDIRWSVKLAAELGDQLKALDAELVAAEAEARAVLAPWADWERRRDAAMARAARAQERAAAGAMVQAAKEALPGLRDALVEAEGEVSRLTARLEELTSARIAGAGERIAGLFSALETVHSLACDHMAYDEIADVAMGGMETDREAVTAAQQTPVQVKETKERLAAAKQDQVACAASLKAAELQVAKSAEVDSAEADRAAALAEAKEVTGGHEAAAAQVEQINARVSFASNPGKLTELRAALEQLQPALAKAKPLENAETRLLELEPVLADFDQQIATLEATIAALPPIPDEPVRPDLKHIAGQLERAEGLLRFERDGIARLEQSLEQAKAVDAKAADIEAERVATEARLGNLTRLSLDFGRTGLQSAEVDSAGPELTELVNDLLRTCHGPRFTVSVETQRLTSDGKKTVDECLISVIDTEKGTEKEVREHSGGERVILGEAISLALTMLACRRAGFDRPTLFRDESAAALDPANARAWVAMMRRAVELTGADRLLFVSHSPEVVAMADARIQVGA
jgi:exonuclease SbcC